MAERDAARIRVADHVMCLSIFLYLNYEKRGNPCRVCGIKVEDGSYHFYVRSTFESLQPIGCSGSARHPGPSPSPTLVETEQKKGERAFLSLSKIKKRNRHLRKRKVFSLIPEEVFRRTPPPEKGARRRTFCTNSHVTSSVSSAPHVIDGGFTGWEPCSGDVGRRLAPVTDPYNPAGCSTCAGKFEWCDITPAVGRFTYAYFDFNGTHLNILNDWKFNDKLPVQPHCYNQFNAWTGGGSEQWLIKVFGDGHTTAQLNGKELDYSSATGRVGWGRSPLVPDRDHSIFELSFAASPGGFGVRLSDPGPRFGCEVLETDPASLVGTGSSGGGTTVSTADAASFEEAAVALPPSNLCTPGSLTGLEPGCTPLPEVPADASTNEDFTDRLGIAISNPVSSAPHVIDGGFTGWQPCPGDLGRRLARCTGD